MKTEIEQLRELSYIPIYANEWQTDRIMGRLACAIEAIPDMTIRQFLTDAKANIESDPRQTP